MRDFVSIGSVPADEECAQIGDADYGPRSRRECFAFIAQLRRMFGPEPEGAELRMTGFAHDFGTYHEVLCWYEDGNTAAMDYAFNCEGGMPSVWDDQAREELGL